MRRIELAKITIEKFRSFYLENIEFSLSAGLRYLSGSNEVERRLGANGSGKSSLWDALCFCLYGTSVRGQKASVLTQWGHKQPLVEVTLLIDGKSIVIERTGSPERLYIDGQPVAQIDIDRIVGLNRSRFLHSVLYGQAVPLFLDLTIPQRGELLDAVFDHAIWLQASEAAARDYTRLLGEVSRLDEQAAREQGRYEALGDVSALEAQAKAWDEAQGRVIDRAIDEVEKAEQHQLEAKVELQRVEIALAEHPKLHQLQQQVDTDERQKATFEADYRGLSRGHSEAYKSRQFYEHTATCGECGQKVDKAFAKAQIARNSAIIDELEVKMKLNAAVCIDLQQRIELNRDEYNKQARKREFFKDQVSTKRAELREAERIVETLTAAAIREGEAVNPHSALIIGQAQEAERLKTLYKKTQGEARLKRANAQRAEFWKGAFKRIRLMLIQRALAQMEVETESAASALGLPGWKIKFTTETETKSGTTKQGVQVQVFSPLHDGPWEAWSGGEAQRIRLAISMGIAALIQRMAGVSWTLEVFDEPTTFLSEVGKEDLLDCLQWRAQSNGKVLWIVDHHALQHSGFAEVWQVTKTRDGSRMKMIANAVEQ